jgi:hypothetical protein
LISIVSAVLLSACAAASLNAPLRFHNPSRLTYTRIYCTPDTETHFENVTVELSKPGFPIWTDFRPRGGVRRADRPVGQLVQNSFTPADSLMTVLLTKPEACATPVRLGRSL